MTALRRSEFAQADRERVARVGWSWRFWWRLARRLLDDLPGELIRVARTLFTCSGRHDESIAWTIGPLTIPVELKLDHYRKVALYAFVRVYSITGDVGPDYERVYNAWEAKAAPEGADPR